MARVKWRKVRKDGEIIPGQYRTTKGKWWIKRDYDRETTTSDYRNWLLFQKVKGELIRIKQDFPTLKDAQFYAVNPK